MVDTIGEVGKCVKVRLAGCVVVMAMPHDVLGGGAAAFTLRVRALVCFGEPCRVEAVGGAYTPCNDGLQESPFGRVLAIVVFGAFGCEIVHNGSVVEVGGDPYHVLAVSRGFVPGGGCASAVGVFVVASILIGVVVVVEWLVDALLKVIKDGIPGGFSNACGVKSGVVCVKWQAGAIGEDEVGGSFDGLVLDVEDSHSLVEAVSWALWEGGIAIGGVVGVGIVYAFEVGCGARIAVDVFAVEAAGCLEGVGERGKTGIQPGWVIENPEHDLRCSHLG